MARVPAPAWNWVGSMPDRASRRRTVLGVTLALLAGIVFAVTITLLATRIASPKLGLENSPVIVEPSPSVTVTVDANGPDLSDDDDHGEGRDSDDD